MFDLAIIGGGPGGAAAAVYAARKQLKTVLITESFGGQSIESTEIQNWIGTEKISGADLAKSLEAHVRAYAENIVSIVLGSRVTSLQKTGGGFSITAGTASYEARTVLITSGGDRRKLDIPGAREFENRGVVYCASCDGPLFSGQNVAVIGGGNAGFETAAQLLAYCPSVTLIHRGTSFKADPVTVKRIVEDPKMRAIANAKPIEIRGDKFVTSIVIETEGAREEMPVAGIFVEIGMLPNTAFARELVAFDDIGRITVDPRNQRSSLTGIWAAGDCTDGLFHQNNIAAGDAVKALEDIYLHLRA